MEIVHFQEQDELEMPALQRGQTIYIIQHTNFLLCGSLGDSLNCFEVIHMAFVSDIITC